MKNKDQKSMKILWLDINSSYSHSSVALPAIQAQLTNPSQHEWTVVRGTINDTPGSLASLVEQQKPDVVAATFWLFTHQMQVETLSRVNALLDGVTIVCGGPEFLGDNEDFLRRNKFVTAVFRGEGEVALPKWLDFADSPDKWNEVEGLCWIDKEGEYRDNGFAKVLDFSSLKYPEESPFFRWDKPFVQLETTRGCFNTCAFCVSGGEKPVRSQSLAQIRERLNNICNHGIKDIRVLDRTFNYDTKRACEMLDLFCEFKDKMRFHLEIHPALMSEKLKEKIAGLPKGLLHLEAGIQSLHDDVLEACGRKGSLKASLDGLAYLCSLPDVATHADLIAGLPLYSLEMLVDDVRTLVSIGVDELQLESLKLLPGTKMRRDADVLGLRFSPLPPYEVLRTREMDSIELKTAMQVSRMLDFYYNCEAYQKLVGKMIQEVDGFILDFTFFLRDSMVLESPLSQERKGQLLYEYCLENLHEWAAEVSVAWIESGASLKKKPAEKVVKIKNLESFCDCKFTTLYGEYKETHRFFFLPMKGENSAGLIFGYDSLVHTPSPVFKASVRESDLRGL